MTVRIHPEVLFLHLRLHRKAVFLRELARSKSKVALPPHGRYILAQVPGARYCGSYALSDIRLATCCKLLEDSQRSVKGGSKIVRTPGMSRRYSVVTRDFQSHVRVPIDDEPERILIRDDWMLID